ncbi:MAG: M23 family metallopeptidase, partial [Bacteroidota bacterium]
GGGTISAIGRKGGYNIKIRHTSPYSTQYQHISRLAKGVKRGIRVKQGDLIGFVGDQAISLRFMRRNRTIDRSELSLPSKENDQVKENDRKDFEIFKENMILRLAQIPLSDQDKQLLSSYR